MFLEIFSPYENVLATLLKKNKKLISPDYINKHVSAAIMEP